MKVEAAKRFREDVTYFVSTFPRMPTIEEEPVFKERMLGSLKKLKSR